MDAAASWERLSDALLGPYEQDIVEGLTGAYRALEGRIEVAYKRAAEGADTFPLRRMLLLREQLEQELSAMQLPPTLRQSVNQALLDGQQSADFWALAEIRKVQQEATDLSPQQMVELFGQAGSNPDLILSPAMAQQNPSAMIAAAQRQNALSNYAAGARGSQAFASLNRLVEVDLRGRIIGAVEFHLAQGDGWTQLRKTLQTNVALTKSRAQTVARTEMAAAMVQGSKLRYEAEGIEQVQWQAVGSSRTCGTCAPRHGKVYKLGEVVVPAHPNCRCAVTPWDPKWQELGLIDEQAEAVSRAAVLADLEAAGKEPLSGPSPFEKALGLEQAPEALWTPPRQPVGAT
jgi:SPP1 gp7 family putative phage head morphogenesis protein